MKNKLEKTSGSLYWGLCALLSVSTNSMFFVTQATPFAERKGVVCETMHVIVLCKYVGSKIGMVRPGACEVDE